MKRGKKKNRRIKKKRKMKYCFKISIFTILISIILCFSIKCFLIYNVKDEIETNINKLRDINLNYRNTRGRIMKINNFTLEKDTLPFENFCTISSAIGNCEGYSVFEKCYYEKTLYKILGKHKKSNYDGNLGDIEVCKEDMKNIYGKVLNYNNYYKKTRIQNRKIPFLEFLKFYGADFNLRRKKCNKDYSDHNFNNKELYKIICDIDYIHQNKGYLAYIIEPYYSYKIYDPLPNGKGYTKYKRVDINLILNNLSNDKPVVICIGNLISGHALLCYGYEFIDENNIKIFVKDSNCPLIKSNDTYKFEKINEDIKNMYVLFTKEILKNEWSYIYNPKINDCILYDYYNSFVPGTRLTIIP